MFTCGNHIAVKKTAPKACFFFFLYLLIVVAVLSTPDSDEYRACTYQRPCQQSDLSKKRSLGRKHSVGVSQIFADENAEAKMKMQK